jgi:hypothetical protein
MEFFGQEVYKLCFSYMILRKEFGDFFRAIIDSLDQFFDMGREFFKLQSGNLDRLGCKVFNELFSVKMIV